MNHKVCPFDKHIRLGEGKYTFDHQTLLDYGYFFGLSKEKCPQSTIARRDNDDRKSENIRIVSIRQNLLCEKKQHCLGS